MKNTSLLVSFLHRQVCSCLLIKVKLAVYLTARITPRVPELPQCKVAFHPCLGNAVSNTSCLSSLCWQSNNRPNYMLNVTCIQLLWKMLCRKTYVTYLLTQNYARITRVQYTILFAMMRNIVLKHLDTSVPIDYCTCILQ